MSTVRSRIQSFLSTPSPFYWYSALVCWTALIVMGWIQFVHHPLLMQNASYAAHKSEYIKEEQRATELRDKIERLTLYGKEIDTFITASHSQKSIPWTSCVSTILKIAATTGIEVLSVKTGTVTTKRWYEKHTAHAALSGTDKQFSSFFHLLEKEAHAVHVGSIEMHQQPNALWNIQLSCWTVAHKKDPTAASSSRKKTENSIPTPSHTKKSIL